MSPEPTTPEHQLSIATIGALTFALLAWYAWSSGGRDSHLPPGPKTLPILGNILDIPVKKAYLKFTEWSEEYGSVFSLKIGSGVMVVLNDPESVHELMEKRSATSSSRPDSYIGNELISNGNHILLIPYNDHWKLLRRITHQVLGVQAVSEHIPIQEAEAVQTLHDLFVEPSSFFNSIRRYSTSVILSVSFGRRSPTWEGGLVKELYAVQQRFTEILEIGAAPPVDIFPILKYLPPFLAPWKREALAIRDEQARLYHGLLSALRKRVQGGKSPPCFMAEVLQNNDNSYKLNEAQLAWLGGILMEAGSDTTSSTLLSFILAMITWPEHQQRLYEEVHQAVGDTSSPKFADVKDLPFLKACIDEVLRWRPVAAGGIPHTLTAQETVGGYVLPKGAMVLANTWALTHDPKVFDQPDTFDPTRFLDNPSGCEQPARKTTTYPFGVGRRACSGLHLARNSLVIQCASLVWAFEMKKVQGHAYDTSTRSGYCDGFLTCPLDFPCDFTPRHPTTRGVVDAELEQAGELFQKFQ